MTKNLLKEVSFTLETKLGLSGVLARTMNEANSWTNFKIGRVKALAMRTIEGIGNAQDTGKIVQMFLFRFGKVQIPAVGRRGNAFAVVAREQGNEIGLGAGKAFPGVLANEAGGLLVMRAFFRGGGPTNVVK